MQRLETLSIDQVKMECSHWMQATSRLARLENLASSYAWNGIDRHVRELMIDNLSASIKRIKDFGRQLEMQLELGAEDYTRIRKSLLSLRQQYVTTETTVHFFTDALNSRTNPSVASLLRACDIMCSKSMEAILPQLGKEVPHCFTYLDRGMGASILKSGLRLWDGSISPVAAIKITFHNLFRPTAAIHETGHQVAHILSWNNELAMQLNQQLNAYSPRVANAYASWASEIAADNFAFVHTGYAGVASLHNVVAGTPESVFAYHDGDPHPISYLRVLLNIECCRAFYGSGPWDNLEKSFKQDYPIQTYNYSSIRLIKACEQVLKKVVDICLTSTYKAFNGKSLTSIINPMNVSPSALEKFESISGALIQSHAWINKECLKLLALAGYKIATQLKDAQTHYRQQEQWMINLGTTVEKN